MSSVCAEYTRGADASDDAAANLVELDGLEQRLEVALAEAIVALALDDLEEDRPDHILCEDLQQQARVGIGGPVDQDAQVPERFIVSGVSWKATSLPCMVRTVW